METTTSGKVAYTIEEAASVIGRDPHVIVDAIRHKELIARLCDGEPLILKRDVIRWALTLPNYYVTS